MGLPASLEGVYAIRTTQDWVEEVQVCIGNETTPDILDDVSGDHVVSASLTLTPVAGVRGRSASWSTSGGVLQVTENRVTWDIDKAVVAAALSVGDYNMRLALVWSSGLDEDLLVARARVS